MGPRAGLDGCFPLLNKTHNIRYIHFPTFFVVPVFDMLGICWFILCFFGFSPPDTWKGGRSEAVRRHNTQIIALTMSGEGKILRTRVVAVRGTDTHSRTVVTRTL